MGKEQVMGHSMQFGNVKVKFNFPPLNPITDEWEQWFIETYNIKLCELYYPPFNFKRTGCKGCPFSLDLQEQLNIMEKYIPNEAKTMRDNLETCL